MKELAAKVIASMADPVQLWGAIAMICSIVILVLGLPKQIRSNYKQKSTKGLDMSLIYCVLAAYFTWTIYGWVKRDVFIVVSQAPGVLEALVIIGQRLHYGKVIEGG